jgi:choline dehydrogenase-like flavoprotein
MTAVVAGSRMEGVPDRDCRLSALPNLYVVDGSFMPTSGGVNLILTITANALRVAGRIAAALALEAA